MFQNVRKLRGQWLVNGIEGLGKRNSCIPEKLKNILQCASASAHAGSSDPTPSSAKLEGRVAVITGGANGLGASCARLFVQNGARVFVADVADSDGEQLCEELGSSAHYFHCNVTNEKDISDVVDLAVKQYGKLDIMHNNVGVGGEKTTIQDIDIRDFDKIYALNMRSVVLGLKHAARVMIPRQSGSILSTCSVAGLMGGAGPSPYAFTKSAIPGITRQAAAELGTYGIRINCISPGGTPTQSQLRRVQQIAGYENLTFEEYGSMMDEISELKGGEMRTEVFARTALFLASDDSSFTTGQNFVVDGGFSVSKAYPLELLRKTFTPEAK